MTSYLGKIQDFIERLDQETLLTLKNISTTKTLKKGDYLLRQDEVCKKSYLIEKGIARNIILMMVKKLQLNCFLRMTWRFHLTVIACKNRAQNLFKP
jgi:hypothetical protein